MPRLYKASAIRQHAPMRTIFGEHVAGIASGLNDTTIHVWVLDYLRSMQRLPLQALLGLYLGVPREAVILCESEHGRPELPASLTTSLRFNWSHSGDKAIIAVARGITPGIDMERVRSRPRAMALAERFFHPDEVAALAALDGKELEYRFLQLWTGKEAVLKAVGRGVAFGLHRLRLHVLPQEVRLLWLEDDEAAAWQLRRLNIDQEHVANLAWRGPPMAIEIRTLAESG